MWWKYPGVKGKRGSDLPVLARWECWIPFIEQIRCNPLNLWSVQSTSSSLPHLEQGGLDNLDALDILGQINLCLEPGGAVGGGCAAQSRMFRSSPDFLSTSTRSNPWVAANENVSWHCQLPVRAGKLQQRLHKTCLPTLSPHSLCNPQPQLPFLREGSLPSRTTPAPSA